MMNETGDFCSYLDGLVHDIPLEIYFGATILLCLGLVFLIKCKGIKQGSRFAVLLAFIEYVTLVYCSTVLFRAAGDVRKYDFHPFWSYNDPNLFFENVMNVVVFVPVGLLLSCISRRLKWWIVLLVGLGISLSIESLQFVLKRGFSEVDDVIHNTLGCAIGFGLYSLIRYEYKRVCMRRVGTLVET